MRPDRTERDGVYVQITIGEVEFSTFVVWTPQHEEPDSIDWERGYYGEAEHETPSRAVEFVPEVEHRSEATETAENEDSRGDVRPRPLSASD